MSQPYVGEIRQFGGSFAPVGWMLCQGQILPISEYDVLFNLIGTTYGGDGQETFALPDLQGRFPIHMGNGAGSTYVLGQKAGTEAVTLTTNQIPAHTHIPNASDVGGVDTPQGTVWATASGNAKAYGAVPGNATFGATSIQPAGGSQPHDNMMPFTAVSYIISLYGIYPSQS